MKSQKKPKCFSEQIESLVNQIIFEQYYINVGSEKIVCKLENGSVFKISGSAPRQAKITSIVGNFENLIGQTIIDANQITHNFDTTKDGSYEQFFEIEIKTDSDTYKLIWTAYSTYSFDVPGLPSVSIIPFEER